jgi:hypothetical protein
MAGPQSLTCCGSQSHRLDDISGPSHTPVNEQGEFFIRKGKPALLLQFGNNFYKNFDP